jgi:predicted dinucleotide-binding enzyme/quercetin dioxygenase-like cupin family protein
MRIGILGSGLMGGKLGTIFARAGHEVVFSYVRSSQKLKRLARDAQDNARAGTPAEAATDSDALLLAVHWSRIDDLLKQAGDLSAKVILTCCLPMDAGNTKLIIGTTTSGAEELAKKVQRAHVVAAFQTIPGEVLFGVFEAKLKNTRPTLVYCGDDQNAKDVAAKLIADVGFDPVDAGGLRIARYTEPFTLLVGELAHGREVARNWHTVSSGLGNNDGQVISQINLKERRNGHQRSDSQPASKGPAEYFTGTVRVASLFQAPNPARVVIARVTFEPGARTAWHTHPLGQTLIVTAGRGWVQRWGGPVEEIRPGDVVWIPPAEKHWHGASPTTAMTHIAIQEQLDGKTADWMEKVSDEQYQGAA